MMRLLRIFLAITMASAMLTACTSNSAEPIAVSELGPLDAPYQLGAGDKLRITVFGEEELTGEYSVTGSGAISFPLIGNVTAAGQTVEQLQEAIRGRLAEGYVNDPRVSAEVLTYRPFYILGEVTRPGQYPFSVGMTVQQAVATAGGFTYRANTRRIFLKRAQDTGERQVEFDRGRPIPIRPGDTIRIGERFF